MYFLLEDEAKTSSPFACRLEKNKMEFPVRKIMWRCDFFESLKGLCLMRSQPLT